MALNVYATQTAEKYNPIKSSFEFRGWYADEACTKKYDFNSPDSDNIVYVKWTEHIDDLADAGIYEEERNLNRITAVAGAAAAAVATAAAIIFKRR